MSSVGRHEVEGGASNGLLYPSNGPACIFVRPARQCLLRACLLFRLVNVTRLNQQIRLQYPWCGSAVCRVPQRYELPGIALNHHEGQGFFADPVRGPPESVSVSVMVTQWHPDPGAEAGMLSVVSCSLATQQRKPPLP